MANLNTRWAAAGALAVAALAGPVVAALSVPAVPEVSATGNCLAWFGSRDDGQCIGYPMAPGLPSEPQLRHIGAQATEMAWGSPAVRCCRVRPSLRALTPKSGDS